jgi:hypothetical protein
MSVEFVPVLSSGMPLYARLNESTKSDSSCSSSSTSEHVPLCEFPTPVCRMMGILPTWQQGSTWMLVQEGDEGVRGLVPGGGMIDMRAGPDERGL